MIDNPGYTNRQRTVLTIGAAAVAGVVDLLLWDWPASVMMAEQLAPLVHMGLVAAGAFLLVPVKMDQYEIAIAEFAHLGLRPEIIGSVIVENREKAMALQVQAASLSSSMNQGLVRMIVDEALSIITDFADDPSDVSRSRTILSQCLDQTKRVIDSYMLIEARKGVLTNDEFLDIAMKTELGLKQIHEALVEQHRRNLDNNQTALEIDLEISDQLLRKS